MRKKSVTRSSHLIAHFDNGYAIGWYMAVKDSFRNELDIKYLPRQKRNTTYYEWSQGPYYCFSQGQTFYDSILAYSQWNEALKHTSIGCQILEARPNIPNKTINIETGKSVVEVLEGYVKFALFETNETRTCMKEKSRHEVTQNEFVDFLKTGKLRS